MSDDSTNPCRCGWSGDGQHLCHRCGVRAGVPRYVVTPGTSLAGMRPKVGVYQTIGCDDCWNIFKVKL